MAGGEAPVTPAPTPPAPTKPHVHAQPPPTTTPTKFPAQQDQPWMTPYHRALRAGWKGWVARRMAYAPREIIYPGDPKAEPDATQPYYWAFTSTQQGFPGWNDDYAKTGIHLSSYRYRDLIVNAQGGLSFDTEPPRRSIPVPERDQWIFGQVDINDHGYYYRRWCIASPELMQLHRCITGLGGPTPPTRAQLAVQLGKLGTGHYVRDDCGDVVDHEPYESALCADWYVTMFRMAFDAEALGAELAAAEPSGHAANELVIAYNATIRLAFGPEAMYAAPPLVVCGEAE